MLVRAVHAFSFLLHTLLYRFCAGCCVPLWFCWRRLLLTLLPHYRCGSTVMPCTCPGLYVVPASANSVLFWLRVNVVFVVVVGYLLPYLCCCVVAWRSFLCRSCLPVATAHCLYHHCRFAFVLCRGSTYYMLTRPCSLPRSRRSACSYYVAGSFAFYLLYRYCIATTFFAMDSSRCCAFMPFDLLLSPVPFAVHDYHHTFYYFHCAIFTWLL